MDYIKIRLSADLDQAGKGLRRTLDDIFGGASPIFYQLSRTWKPQMDLFETADEIKIIATVAGVEKETMEIEINERAVRISGDRRPPASVAEATFCLAEIQYGKFERILFLPKPIDTERVSASLSAGILQITMVKQRARKSLKVTIRDEDE
jgi:HSP20 family protein